MISEVNQWEKKNDAPNSKKKYLQIEKLVDANLSRYDSYR